jgi:hypothetical protein
MAKQGTSRNSVSKRAKTKTRSFSKGDVLVFRVRADWWYMLATFGVILILIAAIPLTIWNNTGGPLLTALTVIIAMVLALSRVDRLLYTTYTLEQEGLVIQSLLHRVVYPYRAMVELRKIGMRGAFAGFFDGRRHATSHRGLLVSLREQDVSAITLSPADLEQFTATLLERIEYDRTHRKAAIIEDSHF